MKAAFDRAIGRAPMHGVTVIWLLVLVLAAFALSASGQLFYTPLQLLLSATVLVVTAVVVNWVCALVLRTRPHVTSAIITGLLLFFLFWPVSDAGGLAVLALTAAIAILSKYVLAVRGRHLFNPAALGAFVITLTGLTASVWWVATGWLLPFAAVGALFVLYRTRKVAVGVLFVVVATLIVTTRLVLGGADLASSLAVVFTSYPVVFFAGFMLSEPLTLPPRRWQQLVVAALAGVLFSIPFAIGPVFSTPELALLVGNLVAFAFVGVAGLRLVYRGKRQIARNVYEFEFDAPRPLGVLPGQYLELSLPHRADPRGSRRPFSVITRPGEAGRARHVTFGVRVSEPLSSFKRALMDLEPGSRLVGTWVGGDFVAPRDADSRQLLVAGGIGVTPFVSELREFGHGMRGSADIVVVYSVPTMEDAAYLDDLAAAGVPVYLAVTGGDVPTDLAPTITVLPRGRLTPEALAAVPGITDRLARVSGPPAFVDQVRTTLRRAGVRRVHTDVFAGY